MVNVGRETHPGELWPRPPRRGEAQGRHKQRCVPQMAQWSARDDKIAKDKSKKRQPKTQAEACATYARTNLKVSHDSGKSDGRAGLGKREGGC